MTGEYTIAVHALIYLNHMGTMLSSEKMASNICTNPARVRKVLAKLKRAGLVETREGSEGGYRFQKDPHQVTLRQVAEAVETTFVECSWHSGGEDIKCQVASGMAGVMDDICSQLNGICLERLEQVTIAQIEERLFHNQ